MHSMISRRQSTKIKIYVRGGNLFMPIISKNIKNYASISYLMRKILLN